MQNYDQVLRTLGFGIGVMLAVSLVSTGIVRLGSPVVFCIGALILLCGGLLMMIALEQGQ